MKKWLRILGMACTTAVISLVACVWPKIGTPPSNTGNYDSSPNFDASKKQFVNRQQEEYQKMMDNFDFLALMKKQILGTEQRTPTHTLPVVSIDWEKFQQSTEDQYYWLGHSTILLKMDGKTLLFDPVFGSASPLSFVVPRFSGNAVQLAELPPIDVVLISHDHYDHLSYDAIQHFKNTDTQFLVPLGVSSYLVHWGIAPERITELDWWQETSLFGLNFACTPSQHFSGRRGPRGNTTLWASWVVIAKEHRIYFSGDSGYDIHFSQIGEKYGPFDLAFMENGQYNAIWPMSHMFPQETVQAGVDIQAKNLQPIHWGAFKLSTHQWNEPVLDVVQYAKETELSILLPKIGEQVEVDNAQNIEKDGWYQQP